MPGSSLNRWTSPSSEPAIFRDGGAAEQPLPGRPVGAGVDAGAGRLCEVAVAVAPRRSRVQPLAVLPGAVGEPEGFTLAGQCECDRPADGVGLIHCSGQDPGISTYATRAERRRRQLA